jgi:hypothetical protein
MSDEIILILSSDDDASSIIEVLPLLLVTLESSEVGTPGVVVNHTIHVSDLNTFLRSTCVASHTLLSSRQSTAWIIQRSTSAVFVLAVAHFT